MDTAELWQLIDDARAQVPHGGDAEAVAARASSLLAERPAGEIRAAQQVLWDLMSRSYTAPLWAAAYTINGGCSDDGFDYFRGWLIAQGREAYEAAVSDPDSLAGLAAVREAAVTWEELECEPVLAIAWDAHLKATGQELPGECFTIDYPLLDPEWDFDFDDADEVARRLPRTAALHA
ncbi:DUF4240 domain-containing protein [Streptomyces sp. MBT27]|uniref:DUF4240 domain-containing protein n=1 Tax=Streptomyces sp. MBT27 TaxID=1488356 RepID=UPI0014244775|nr:DUF4240 domain-containing protein [Streptomyces sp. MBT27]